MDGKYFVIAGLIVYAIVGVTMTFVFCYLISEINKMQQSKEKDSDSR